MYGYEEAHFEKVMDSNGIVRYEYNLNDRFLFNLTYKTNNLNIRDVG